MIPFLIGVAVGIAIGVLGYKKFGPKAAAIVTAVESLPKV